MLQIRDCVPGAMVECIDKQGWRAQRLTLKALYTIDSPNICPCDGGFRIVLEEIQHGPGMCQDLCNFRIVPEERLEVFRQAAKDVDIPNRIPEKV